MEKDHFTLENEGKVFHQNGGNHSPSDPVSHDRHQNPQVPLLVNTISTTVTKLHIHITITIIKITGQLHTDYKIKSLLLQAPEGFSHLALWLSEQIALM